MPGALDQFLSIAIPVVAFGVFGFMIYKAFGEQIDRFVEWFKGLFQKGKDSFSDTGYNYNTGRRKDTWYPGDIDYR